MAVEWGRPLKPSHTEATMCALPPGSEAGTNAEISHGESAAKRFSASVTLAEISSAAQGRGCNGLACNESVGGPQ